MLKIQNGKRVERKPPANKHFKPSSKLATLLYVDVCCKANTTFGAATLDYVLATRSGHTSAEAMFAFTNAIAGLESSFHCGILTSTLETVA